MTRRPALTGLALAMAVIAPAHATDLSIAIKPQFTTGTYGTTTRTRVWETPLEIKLHEPGYGFGLRLPYAHETGNQIVVPGLGPVGDPRPSSFHRQGLGNLRLSAWATVWKDPDSGATLGVAAKLTPPAIRNIQPMGVNFTRIGLELEASIPLPYDVSLDLSLGRRFIIGAPGLGLNDFWYGTVDIGHELNDRWSFGLTIDTQSSSGAGGTAILEIGPWLEYRFAPGWTVGAYLFRGFTRDSADWGGGFTLTHRFGI